MSTILYRNPASMKSDDGTAERERTSRFLLRDMAQHIARRIGH